MRPVQQSPVCQGLYQVPRPFKTTIDVSYYTSKPGLSVTKP